MLLPTAWCFPAYFASRASNFATAASSYTQHLLCGDSIYYATTIYSAWVISSYFFIHWDPFFQNSYNTIELLNYRW